MQIFEVIFVHLSERRIEDGQYVVIIEAEDAFSALLRAHAISSVEVIDRYRFKVCSEEGVLLETKDWVRC